MSIARLAWLSRVSGTLATVLLISILAIPAFVSAASGRGNGRALPAASAPFKTRVAAGGLSISAQLDTRTTGTGARFAFAIRRALPRPSTVPATGLPDRALLAGSELFLAAEDVIDPAVVRFSQDSVRGTFKDGRSIDDLVAGLKGGSVKSGDVPAIRLVERDGDLFSLDNRRLLAFQRAGVPVPYRMATADEAASEAWKFTTTNGGVSIRVRGD